MKKILTLLISLLLTTIAFAQPNQNDSQLAFEYFRTGEYDKASEIFENLFKNTKAKVYFEYYIQCLIALKEFENAEKAIKKQITRKNPDLQYIIELGNLYKVQNKNSECTEQYNFVLKNIPQDRNLIISIANSFIQKKDYDWAEKTYSQGITNFNYSFDMEKANLYAIQRKYTEMINAYLDVLNFDESQLTYIQNVLQQYIIFEVENEITPKLKTALLQRIQTNPNRIIYNTFLTWLYIQQKEFKNALIQAKAIDKRLREDGKRINELAELSLSNNDFDVAIEAYQYVQSKGLVSPQYKIAITGELSVLYQKVENGLINSQFDIQELEKKYLTVINDMGINIESINIIKDLAHIQTFYLNRPDDAIKLLTEAIAIRGLSSQMKGICQIKLADIMLFTGNIWDATLIYAKAENDNKNNHIGDLAKFSKAHLAYYAGNFNWAEAQLDVLKASTSKLIANDALELSQLIKENKTEDSIQLALTIFARADLLAMQRKDSLAMKSLDSIINFHQSSPLIDDTYFKKAEIYGKNKNYIKQAEYLQLIIDKYPFQILGHKATYKLAFIYDNILNDKTKAMELYKKLIVDYPGSIYTVDARKRFRELRGN